MLIGAVALNNYLNADAAVFGSGLVIVVAVVLLLLFIPKVMVHCLLPACVSRNNYISCEM